MTGGYTPTTSLRFVKRLVPVTEDTARVTLVLQQRWVSGYVGEPDEWCDVPTADLPPEDTK